MTNLTDKDYTPLGLRIEGPYENDRNVQSKELFKAILREAYDADESIVGHHLIYVQHELRPDPDHPGNFYPYEIVQEVPSADALIFDHGVAKKIWGDAWQSHLTLLALEPVETRDALLKKFYEERVR